ncbi:protein kinase domain-containing protein [Microlunatus flavus]|uniref:Cell envelope-related function transcriptional attenuator common domain-containing protein n=1 Tax=Microlunatus flavus TaxID=1036181 RepID=A0A1H9MTB8_9ACTN|nr:protein kinase [Microlunatus flavus]SER26888.1 cell envelope-related function transcriptional attenuator common domain-containing protein [Microlunatus flavus]
MAVLTAPDIPGMSGWRPLARGGFATVWQARQESLDRLVAVKVDARTLDTETERDRFLSEARTAGGLSGHAGIVTVHDAGILEDGRPYLVMDLCPGGSLTRWQSPEGRQDEDRVRAVGVRIADALSAAHAQGMLHRDVKPANILIDRYGHAGLADFGLAGHVESSSGEGITPAYAPPEVLRGERASEAGDVYQLGATLYAVLGGSPPHGTVDDDLSLPELLARFDEPVAALPGVSPALMRVVLGALATDPAERPTAAELRDRLAATAPLPASTRRRRTTLLVAVGVVVAVLALVLGASGVYLYEVDRSVTANISRGLQLTPDTKRPPKDPAAVDTLNYLLIGKDAGDKSDPERNDAIMLVHLTQARDQAYVISFPRDLVVPDGDGTTTLGRTYDGEDDVSPVVRAVEAVTSTPVDHVAMIDFTGFVGLTEELGGVTVDNRRKFESHGFTYPVGRITLSGESALAYVRQGSTSERDRAEHQRDMLKAILTKGLSPEVLARPRQFTQFVGNAAKRIQVDSSLSDSELRSTALSLRLGPSDIRLLAVPVEKAVRQDGETVEPVDAAQMAELSDGLRTDRMAAYLDKHPNG